MGEMEKINYLPQTTRKIQEQNMWCLYHPHFIEGEIEQVEKLRFGCCCCSVAKSCPTLCNPMDCSTTGSSFRYFPESAQIHVHWVSVMLAKHLILYCPLLLWPSIFPSLRVFSNESALCIRWPKYWSFSFSISPSNEYSGLISFRIDWFLSLCSPQDSWVFSSTTIQKRSALMDQLSHPYIDRLKLEPSVLIPEDPTSVIGMSEAKRGVKERMYWY